MINHYLKIAWRNLLKYKTQSIISILGLAIGFVAFSFTMSWIKYERSFDAHLADANRIYKVHRINKKLEGGVEFRIPPPLKRYLENMPEVEAVTAIQLRKEDWKKDADVLLPNANIITADSSFFKVFYPHIQINYQNDYADSQFIISERASQKLNLNHSDIGKYSEAFNFTLLDIVTGLPNTHTNIPFDIMSVQAPYEDPDCPWCYYSSNIYVRINENADIKTLSEKLSHLDIEGSMQGIMSYILVPIKETHYKYPENKAKIKYNHLQLFAAVSLLIVLSALFNYLMLFVSKIKLRSRELALRQVSGASNHNSVFLLITELAIIMITALLLSSILTELLYPAFIKLSEIQISQLFLLKDTLLHGAIVFLVTILVSFVLIHIFMRRSIREVMAPSQHTHAKVKNSFINTSLLIQLSISILLIFSTFILQYQLRTLNNNDIGFNRFNINEFQADVQMTKDEISKIPGVEKVILYDRLFLPREGSSFLQYSTEHGEKIAAEMFRFIEPDLIDFFEIKIIEGRNVFYGETNACLINETAKREFQMEGPIGKQVNNFTIVGVIADMYIDSPLLPVLPSVYLLKGETQIAIIDKTTGEVRFERDSTPASASEGINKRYYTFAYKYTQGHKERTEQAISDLITKQGGNYLVFSSPEDTYAEFTVSERYILVMLGIMGGVATLIALFGIYSIVTLSCNMRRKEIAIRKVNGARVKDIFYLFYKKYFVLTIGASLVAFTVGVYIMQLWLQQYTRRVTMKWWIFAGVLGIVVLIVFSGIFYRVWITARINPAEVVKSN